MRKLQILLFSAVLSFLALSEAQAQNLQVMYDTERGCVTSTIEMFRPDNYGSTFFFVDMDYNSGISGSYWEIARELSFWQESKWNWLSVHVEYNGGCSVGAGSFNDSWLGGLTYSGHSKDFSKTWSLSAMYKCIPGTRNNKGKLDVHNFQLTGVWGIEFGKGWFSHSGFVDFWREHRAWQNTEYIFLSEVQFWVNLNKMESMKNSNLSVGTEVEISNNFVDKGFYAIPTLAAKWTF